MVSEAQIGSVREARPAQDARAEKRQRTRIALDEDIPAPRLARRILVVVVCSYIFTGILDIQEDNPGEAGHIGSYICLGLVFALQVAHLSGRALRWPLRLRILTLSTQAVLTYLPFILFHQLWGGMAGLLAGSFLILIRRPAAWVLFCAVSASMAVVAISTHETGAWIAYFVVSTYLLGLIVYGLSRLVQLVGQLHEARSDLARMAVAQERLRFARDLHDLLGYSLSSITLKSELTYRLVHIQPEQARRELASILDVARQALADVRVVASGYRDLHLDEEAEAVQSVLQAAGVDTQVEISCGELPSALDTVLATTLREGVTNILRHSKVQHCEISCIVNHGHVLLVLVNDGVDEPGPIDSGSDEHSGTGLDNLSQRLRAVGGTLTAGVGQDRRFRLAVRAPLAQRKHSRHDGWEVVSEEV